MTKELDIKKKIKDNYFDYAKIARESVIIIYDKNGNKISSRSNISIINN